jgi:hypothetical protein
VAQRGVDLLTSRSALTILASVLRFVVRTVTILALCCAIGLHWLVLQSLAWTTMVIEYSKHAPLRAAITQAFDGTHPCSICHAVNTGKNSEKKSDLQSPTARIDMICPPGASHQSRSFVPFEYASINFFFFGIGHSPPVPPPRSLLS